MVLRGGVAWSWGFRACKAFWASDMAAISSFLTLYAAHK